MKKKIFQSDLFAFTILLAILFGIIAMRIATENQCVNKYIYVEELNVLDTTDYSDFSKLLDRAKLEKKSKMIITPESIERFSEKDGLGPDHPFFLDEPPVKNLESPSEKNNEATSTSKSVSTPKPTKKPESTPKPTPEPTSEPIDVQEETTESEQPEMEYLYTAYVTGYDPYCSHCCGSNTGKTASGQQAVPWGTCASNTLPFGTVIYIEGLGYFTVNDTGGMSGNTVDLAVNSHDEAYAVTGTYKIYKVN